MRPLPLSTRDLLLRGAERYLYEVRWSVKIIEEVHRNLVEDQRCTGEQAGHLVSQMMEAFPEANVTENDTLTEAMTNDEADRHVLAAAITVGADVIVTDNVRHFPPAACGVKVLQPTEATPGGSRRVEYHRYRSSSPPAADIAPRMRRARVDRRHARGRS